MDLSFLIYEAYIFLYSIYNDSVKFEVVQPWLSR